MLVSSQSCSFDVVRVALADFLRSVREGDLIALIQTKACVSVLCVALRSIGVSRSHEELRWPVICTIETGRAHKWCKATLLSVVVTS